MRRFDPTPCARILLALLLGAAGLAGAARAQDVSAPRAGEAPHRRWEERTPEERERLRLRWEEKTPEERELLRRRFEEWRALDPERRGEILERLRHWQEHEESMREDADEALRDELERLAPEERERRWRDHALERFRKEGHRLLDGLAPEVRERLEQASPEERRDLLAGLEARRGERCSHALRCLGRRLGLSEERVRELEALPPEEREERILELRRELIERGIRAEGLPPGLDERRWERMRDLPHEEFFRRFRPFCGRERARAAEPDPTPDDGRDPGRP